MLATVAAALVLAANGLTADEIVARHIAASGGEEKLKSIATVVYSRGTYREGDHSSSKAFMALMRPYYKIVGDPSVATDFREGYDGSTWEWYADPGVVIRTVGAAAAAGRHNIWPEGPFVDYRAKGTTIAHRGEETIDGRPAFRLTVTLRDGFARDYFIDQETYLISAERFSAPIHAFGDDVSTETRIGDYKRIAGVLFPHSFRETDIKTGKELNSMQWGSIEVNRELPRSWFSPPEFTRTELQSFLEQLYMQRTDPAAANWVYAEFRRAHPSIDTRQGVELIGYQMLKMADHEAAISILKANAADHPRSASAAFALGRAYATANQAANARREYERALALEPNHGRAADALTKLK